MNKSAYVRCSPMYAILFRDSVIIGALGKTEMQLTLRCKMYMHTQDMKI